MGDFAYGVPEWDICMIFYMANYIPEERCRLLYHIGTDTMHRHWQYFVSEYYGQMTPQEYRDMELMMRRMAVTKIIFRRAKYENSTPFEEPFLQFIRNMIGLPSIAKT